MNRRAVILLDWMPLWECFLLRHSYSLPLHQQPKQEESKLCSQQQQGGDPPHRKYVESRMYLTLIPFTK